MRKITKALAIGTVVAAVGGIGLAAMAETSGPSGGPPFMHGHMGPGMMGMGNGPQRHGFSDPAAHLATLKTDLGIKPEQATAWDAYAKVVQDTAAQMQAIRGSIDFDKLRTMSWNDHLAYMGQLHDRQATAFKSVQAAATTLLAALDDTQKAHVLLPSLEYFGPGMMGSYGGSPMMGPGYGMMSWGPSGGR